MGGFPNAQLGGRQQLAGAVDASRDGTRLSRSGLDICSRFGPTVVTLLIYCGRNLLMLPALLMSSAPGCRSRVKSMKLTPIVLLIGYALLMPSAVVRAQSFDLGQLHTFTRSQPYQTILAKALAAVPDAVLKRCPTLVSHGSKVILIKPVTLGEGGIPNGGAWKQSFPVSGCGNDTLLNFYFSATSDQKINTIVGAPGTTLADVTLQQDAGLYANAAASGAEKGCKTFTVKNTKFEAFGLAKPATPDPGTEARFRPWWETWTVVGCNRIIDVPIDFVPHDGGTQVIQPGGLVQR